MTAIPHDHRSGPILILRNHPFEITVFERMIFDMKREALIAGNELGPLATAQLFKTPSSSSRKSSCSLRAACFCTTKRRISGLAVSRVVRPEGSMVFENHGCAYRLRALLKPASACLFDAALAWRGFGPGGGAATRLLLHRGRGGFFCVR